MTDKPLLRAAAHPEHTNGITRIKAMLGNTEGTCKFPLHIGLFFDGTRNNQDWDGPQETGRSQRQRQADSNVARLYRAYPDRPIERLASAKPGLDGGYYPYYIPGVGTPFPEVGEDSARLSGAGFAAGGDARIIYALLLVLNTMHKSIANGIPMQEDDTVKALCRNGAMRRPPGRDSGSALSMTDQYALAKVGMENDGGLQCDGEGNALRTAFLKKQFAELAPLIKKSAHPELAAVFIDVFGFSRGAAEARVFCNWLPECCDGDTLAGVNVTFRFLGIFDTVAAVGRGPEAGGDGHHDWGAPKNLRIPSQIKHCEHYIAMHEQRGSFPLDDLLLGAAGAMPANCRQFRFPGMHSDVGGGYAPGEQGRSKKDEDKLSQIPLTLMYNAAVAAGVPLDKQTAVDEDGRESFKISADLMKDYQAFLNINGKGERAITDCVNDILAWRYYRRRYGYEQSAFFINQPKPYRQDIQDLLETQKIFNDQVGAIERVVPLSPFSPQETDPKRLAEAKARKEVYEEMMKTRNPMQEECVMFERYCHDSYAGFTPYDIPLINLLGKWESGGYLRYRIRYAGSDERLAAIAPTPGESQTA